MSPGYTTCECDYYDHEGICQCEAVAETDDGLCHECANGFHLMSVKGFA